MIGSATTPAFHADLAECGHVHPAEEWERHTRGICRIHARRVTLDAIRR